MAPFTPPSSDAVRARLLLAARDEFAAAGLVGGRVERIAAAASSNKAQVFHYFGSKEGLFDALVEQTVTETFDTVPLDTEDLPGFAGRLHDSGVLPRNYRPAVLLGLVLHLAAFWSEGSPESEALTRAVVPARRRQIVVDAVTSLVGS
jgi:AcrR family transcriptional regulator